MRIKQNDLTGQAKESADKRQALIWDEVVRLYRLYVDETATMESILTTRKLLNSGYSVFLVNNKPVLSIGQLQFGEPYEDNGEIWMDAMMPCLVGKEIYKIIPQHILSYLAEEDWMPRQLSK